MTTTEHRSINPPGASSIEARVSIGPEADAISCYIKDMTTKGAKLLVASDGILPRHFSLIIAIDGQPGDVLNCEQRWRVANTIGVQFVSPVKA